MAKATIFSVYMDNVNRDVIYQQRRCIEALIPPEWDYWQVNNNADYSHSKALESLLTRVKSKIVVILDIDCIPLAKNSLQFVYDYANKGYLVGAIQRANHISNNNHLYVGPFCMAFSLSQYANLGKPSFKETFRGDVGEELTYVWQENGKEVRFMWPNSVQTPQWFLTQKQMFGYGTSYENLFYHQFCSREQQGVNSFVKKCEEVMEKACQKTL